MVVRSRAGSSLSRPLSTKAKARGDGRVAGEWDFLTGREVTRAEIGARTGGGPFSTKLVSERFCSRAMACIVAVSRVVGVEDNRAGVARERSVGKRIDLHEGIGLRHGRGKLDRGRRGGKRMRAR